MARNCAPEILEIPGSMPSRRAVRGVVGIGPE